MPSNSISIIHYTNKHEYIILYQYIRHILFLLICNSFLHHSLLYVFQLIVSFNLPCYYSVNFLPFFISHFRSVPLSPIYNIGRNIGRSLTNSIELQATIIIGFRLSIHFHFIENNKSKLYKKTLSIFTNTALISMIIFLPLRKFYL